VRIHCSTSCCNVRAIAIISSTSRWEIPPPMSLVAYVSFLAKRIERTNEPRVFSYGQFQRLNDAVVMVVSRCTKASGCKGRRRGLQRCVIGDGEPPIIRNVLRLAVFQVACHDSEQVADLLLAALVCGESAVIDPAGETHVRLLSRRVSFPSLPLKENDSWRRAFRETLADHTRLD
jgi:hypothetical protein